MVTLRLFFRACTVGMVMLAAATSSKSDSMASTLEQHPQAPAQPESDQVLAARISAQVRWVCGYMR